MTAARLPLMFGGRRMPRPSSDLSFLSITSAADLPAGSSFARASSATRTGPRGLVESVGNDVMRHEYDPALIYNQFSKPWIDTVVSGLPDGWAEVQQPAHFTPTTTLGIGLDGLTYADVTLTGTPANTSAYVVVLCPNEIAAAQGMQFATDIGACVLPGGTMGAAAAQVGLQEMNGNASIAGLVTAATAPIGTDPVRLRANRTLSSASTTNVRPMFRVTGLTAGVPLSFTLRIVFPVINSGLTYLTDTVPLSTLAARVNGIPQYGLRGLLLEGATTNLVLNSATLVTQNVTVAAVAHTLSFYGTGTVTLSGVSTAGPLVGTGANNRVSLAFTPTAGTLTLTVTGDVRLAQLEASVIPTSYVPTAGTTAARVADSLTLPASLVDFSKSTIAVCYALRRYGSASVLGGDAFSYGAGQHTPERVFINNPSDVPSCSIVAGDVSVAAFPRAGGAAPRDTMLRSCLAWGDGSACHSWDGATAVEDASAASPSPTGPVFRFNGPASGTLTQGASMVLRYVRVWSGRKLTPVQVRSQSARVL